LFIEQLPDGRLDFAGLNLLEGGRPVGQRGYMGFRLWGQYAGLSAGFKLITYNLIRRRMVIMNTALRNPSATGWFLSTPARW
jgi:hypothetical protein